MKAVKVAVTGAAGQIGYAMLTRIIAGDLLQDVPVELRLLEVPSALQALEGVVMELVDCAPKRLVGVEIGADPTAIFDGCNLAFLVGAAPRRKGMHRSDLLGANGRIFVEQGRALAHSAAEDVRVVVTGNPANTNALIAMANARPIPPSRFSALTRLDHNRARSMLARHVRRSVTDVQGITIWGNHSSTQYPDLYNATIMGRPALDWVDDSWSFFDFVPAVAKRGGAIISARGRSSAASAANATIEHVRDWLRGTPPGTWTSMAVPSDGSYGVPEGLISSFPVICNDGDWAIKRDLALNALARNRIQASVVELLQEKAQVKAMGFLP